MNKRIVVAIGLAFFAACIYNPALAQKRIAVIGSSTAAGYFPPATGIPKDSAWVWKMKKYYKDLGIVDTVFNIAQSSTDPYWGMPSSYAPPPNRHAPDPALNITRAVNLVPKPNVIIVNYPSNSYDYFSTAEVMFCLQTIKDSANAKNIECYITSTQPRDGFSPAERQQLKTLRDSILNRFGNYAIDFYTDIVAEPSLTIRPEYSIGDGVHLTPTGHTVLLNKVLEKSIFLVPLPLHFVEVKVQAGNGKNLVEWATADQAAAINFQVEASTDGINFTWLADVKAMATADARYSFVHHAPAAGKQYYRIIARLADGRREISNTVSVTNRGKLLNAQAVFNGNLATIYFKEKLAEPAALAIYSLDGKQIQQSILSPGNATTFTVNLSHLPKGNFVLQVLYQGEKQSFAFVR